MAWNNSSPFASLCAVQLSIMLEIPLLPFIETVTYWETLSRVARLWLSMRVCGLDL